MSDNRYKPTSVNEYFAWLEKTVSEDAELYKTAHAYMEKIKESALMQEEHSGPFLTVVTRTQGKRPQMLAEMLLCLTGQTNTDFELLIMGHNLTDEQHESVSMLISEMPEWMQEKTRLILVDGGTRTTPLNRGFEAAKGKYIAVLDDDDLVFDNWVEAFYNLHKERDGTILHAYTAVQDWEVVGEKFPDTPRAAAAPDSVYFRKFNILEQLKLNTCPLCSLAFPAYAFKEYGIRFDEDLTTTEDWDYLMRCAFVTGVSDTEEVTFLYRKWLNAENSSSVHQKAEWRKNHEKIVGRFAKTPVLLSPSAVSCILGRGNDSAEEEELFYDDGAGFSQDKKLYRNYDEGVGDFRYTFASVNGEIGEISAIRFDPTEKGFVTLTDLLIRVIEEDGKQNDYTLKDVKTNGAVIGDRLVFLKSDPQVVVKFSKPHKADRILINCTVRREVSDGDVQSVLERSPGRIRTFLRRCAKKILKGCK